MPRWLAGGQGKSLLKVFNGKTVVFCMGGAVLSVTLCWAVGGSLVANAGVCAPLYSYKHTLAHRHVLQAWRALLSYNNRIKRRNGFCCFGGVLFVFLVFFLFHNIKILGFLEKESASKSTFLLSINGHRKFPKNESHSWFSSKNKEDQVQQFGYFMKV